MHAFSQDNYSTQNCGTQEKGCAQTQSLEIPVLTKPFEDTNMHPSETCVCRTDQKLEEKRNSSGDATDTYTGIDQVLQEPSNEFVLRIRVEKIERGKGEKVV